MAIAHCSLHVYRRDGLETKQSRCTAASFPAKPPLPAVKQCSFTPSSCLWEKVVRTIAKEQREEKKRTIAVDDGLVSPKLCSPFLPLKKKKEQRTQKDKRETGTEFISASVVEATINC